MDPRRPCLVTHLAMCMLPLTGAACATTGGSGARVPDEAWDFRVVVPDARADAALEIECPDDDYRARFMEEMRSHTTGTGTAAQSGDTLPAAIVQRFYLAQCVKDETMAESIVRAMHAAPRDAIVVHFTGAFHSDFAQGTVARVARRAPDADLLVITAISVTNPASAPVAPQSGRADFVIFTRSASPAARGRPDGRSLP